VKYSDLLVWQKSFDLVSKIYQVTQQFPQEERFGLTGQIRRAAVSIPSNIAEGHGRKATKAYMNHVSIANGSLMELETLIQIAARLAYLDEDNARRLLAATDEIGKMLSGLHRSLDPQSSILNPAE
jgi:four helix bundle protein